MLIFSSFPADTNLIRFFYISGDYQEVDTKSVTCNLLESNQEDDNYTEDGTLDYLSNPANKKKTGTWKACGFILGANNLYSLGKNMYFSICMDIYIQSQVLYMQAMNAAKG